MILFVISYVGGALTILSPCILPVLPFVFARADQPFIKSGLPPPLGMGLTFAAVASLAAVGGGWAVQANQYGRFAAIVLLGLFGVTLLFPEVADRLMRPRIAYRFRARDLHLVLGPSQGSPVRFRVRIDGKPPGEDHGVDIDADGNGTITGERLYQLVRQSKSVAERQFEIEFLDPGAQVFAFTFG